MQRRLPGGQMTRIIAGSLGGRRIDTPPGDLTRPTSDRVREALFSRVESLLGGLAGCAALDLYAGSGAIALEALSRGADRAVLIEADRRAAGVIRRNAAQLGLADRVDVVTAKVDTALAADRRIVADLVVADPPYTVPSAALHATLGRLLSGGWCTADALIVIERPSRAGQWTFPEEVEDVGSRRYGETTLWYGRRCPPGAEGGGAQ
jgi:16S rRNA (guanine(966)-N(2))-methyltransferase RsmD